MLRNKFPITLLFTFLFTVAGVASANQGGVQSHLETIQQSEKPKRPVLALGIMKALPAESRRDFFQALPFELAVQVSFERTLLLANQMDLSAEQVGFLRDMKADSARLTAGELDDAELALMEARLESRALDLFGETSARELFSMHDFFQTE